MKNTFINKNINNDNKKNNLVTTFKYIFCICGKIGKISVHNQQFIWYSLT